MFHNEKNELKRTGIKQQKLFTDNILSPRHKRRASDNAWRAGLVLPKDTLHFTTLISKQFQIGLAAGHNS